METPASEAQTPAQPQQPLTPPSPPSDQAKPIKKPTKLPIILMAIVTLFSLAAAGYFGYQNYLLNKQTSEPQPISIIPSPSSMISGETINAAGFPLLIPKGWKISISNNSDTSFAGRLFIPDTDQSTTYLEVQVGNAADFVVNPTLKFDNELTNQPGLLIKTGKEILLQSHRIVYQVEKEQSNKKLQITFYGEQSTIEKFSETVINIINSGGVSLFIKIPSLVGIADAQEISPTQTTLTGSIAGFSKDLWKEVEIMEGPYPERISKDINPYKGGYAKLYKFKYLIGQRIEILVEENKDDRQAGGSFIESELYNENGNQIIKAQTRLSLNEDQLTESGTYYLLVNSFPNREGRFLLKIFDLNQVQDLYYAHYADGSEYLINDQSRSQSKKQPAVLIVRYSSPIEIVDNSHIRYFRKHDNTCIDCDLYVFGDKTIPYTFKVNNIDVPIKITKLFLNQALIQPADGEAFPENSQVSFSIDYGEDPNNPGGRSWYGGGFRTF